MAENLNLPSVRYGHDFIPEAFLPQGKDEYWLRNSQQEQKHWRALKPGEIEILKGNGNYCADWNSFLVVDPFEPALIRNSNFYGLVRLGSLRNILLKHHDFCVPSGIRGSTIISCDIGDDVAIQDCAYISHYIIGDGCILSRVDEMQTTNHAKFGNGAIKDGESEDVRVWIDVMNEAGGRSILPFDDMIAADAFLWAAFRDDTLLVEKLKDITQERYGGVRGRYGTIGRGSVIKSCSIIKDTAVGEHAYIKGANKLKNLTVLSSYDEPTQIGEGVELVNGIVGYNCHVFYGAKAVRFVIGRNCNLKYGARLIHSVLGDNSTVSCCEILNNLIFPVHEQHHNNSFLIASLIQGQSNIAAAATIGSNHNSRANDGELRAKRGFWPGLAVTLKHPCSFASYVIIAKGEYPSELRIPLPFSLVANNAHRNRLELSPAYFWLHNLYALERNSWKSKARDRRVVKIQQFETDYLAPDTVEEIISGLSLLEGWLAGAGYSQTDLSGIDGIHHDIRVIPCRYLEHSKRGQVIKHPLRAIAAYRQMLRWYAVKNIAIFLDERPSLDYSGLCSLLGGTGKRVSDWVNMGGQLTPAFRVDELRREIGQGKYKNWDEIHNVYALWQKEYPLDKARHAWSVFAMLNGEMSHENKSFLKLEFASAVEIKRWMSEQIYNSRAKDHLNPFRKATFRNEAEMEQVLGGAGDDSFVHLALKEGKDFEELALRVMARL